MPQRSANSGLQSEAFLPSGSRFVPLKDCLNFRHMGGYATDSGKITRGDMLFRSGWFDLSDPSEARRFRALAVERIFDLRTAAEREHRPLNLIWAGAPAVTELPIDKGSMGPYMEKIASMDPSEVDCKSTMTRMYYGMLDDAILQFRDLLSGIARATGPVMMLCSSGKDRTGVGSALLLTALGVNKEAIFQDYLLSASVYDGQEDNFARRHNYEARGISIKLIKDVLTVHPEYLEAVWQRAEEVAGGMPGFIRNVLLLSEEDEARLRDRLTT